MSDPNPLDIQVEALEALIDSIETTPSVGLDRLQGKEDPESIQQRLNILLRADRVKEAADLVRNKEPNARWCENAILAFSRNAELDNARALLQWAAEQDKKTLKQRCSVAFALGTLDSVFDSRTDDDSRDAFLLSDSQRSLLSEGLKTIAPMVAVAKANGAIETALEARASLVALEINRLLGDRAEFDHCAQLIIRSKERKIPLDFAFAVLRYAIPVPADFPNRLRKDYPDSLDAGLAASMIEAQILGDSAKAFASAYLLHDQPMASEKREQLFKFLAELAQTLGEEAIKSVDELAPKLIAPEARFFKLYSAAKHLREDRLDEASKITEETRNEEDPEWLQIAASLELKRGNNRPATDLMIKATKLFPRPELVARAGNMAYRDGRIEDAVGLLEQLLALNPHDIRSRNLLSFLLFGLKRFGDAAGHLEALRALDPDNPIHILNEATSLASAGQLQKSLELFDSICSGAPELPALLGRAQLLKAMNRLADAFSSLQAVREKWWNDPQFLAAFMSTAYAAGKDEHAHQAFRQIRSLQAEDKAPLYLLREVPLEELKKEIQSYQQREEIANQALLTGKMPWILADRLLNRVSALGWALRTQEVKFLAEEPNQRAGYSLYSTNGFRIKTEKEGAAKVEVLQAPAGKTPIVADLSALITLNHLGLLDKAAGYYGTILIPADYHQTAIEEQSRLSDVQLSRVTSLKKIKSALDKGLVLEFADTLKTDKSVTELREHIPDTDTEKRPYRIRDIASALFELGEINEKELDNVHKVAHKPALAELGARKLEAGDTILCDLSTMITLDAGGCLEKALQFFRLYLTAEETQKLLSSIRHLEFQETVRKSHAELWDNIRKDSRFVTETYEVPTPSEQAPENSDDLNLALSSSLLAQQRGAPLLADDRASQALVLNNPTGNAFGTDKFLDRLAKDGRLGREEIAGLYLELIKRRYRFLVPTSDLLKAFADRYEQHPPGRELREVARYVHDCMRDSGLFVGFEKTEPPTTIANHLFLEWTQVITDFVMDCWSDESYAEDRASRLTQWAMSEFLPSPPSTLFWRAQRALSSYLPNVVFARAMIKSIMMPTKGRANKALVSIANSLGIDQDTYTDLVIGAINVFGDSRARRR